MKILLKKILIALVYISIIFLPWGIALYDYYEHSFFFSTRNDWFSQFILHIKQNIYFYIWLFTLFLALKWNSFVSLFKDIILFFKAKEKQDTLFEHNDGYILKYDFGKRIFADNILQMINNFYKDKNRTNNLVIGLDGKWGNGKTYVLKQIKEIIKSGKYPDFYHFSFQPWVFAKNINYTNAFVDKLNSELKKINYGINIVYLSAFKDILDKDCGFWGKIILFFINKSDEELKEIIQQKINQSEKQFIITIDDLDRLDPQEILQIFKLIRCVANFENVYFILCLDRKVVENSIDKYFQQFSNNNDVATHYCDKIINLYFEVPTITAEDLNTLLDNLISQDTELKTWKEKTNSYQTSFRALNLYYYPQNIREIKIIINKLKAASIFKYQTLEEKYELLSQNVDFYIFKTLEIVKLKDIDLYNSIKSSILQNISLPKIDNSAVEAEVNTLIRILKKTKFKHFYFAYNSGDLPISYEQYQLILQKLSYDEVRLLDNHFSELDKNRYLVSFFIHAINDQTLSSQKFTQIVSNYEFQREATKEFNILFNQKLPLLNIKEYFQQDYSSLSQLHTYDLINISENSVKRAEYIHEYVETYNTKKSYLPRNNLIFYIDFEKYTPELYGVLFQQLISNNIDVAPGLLDLLDKFVEQTNGDTTLWNINIIKKQCNLPFFKIINKLDNDYVKAKKTLHNYKLEKRALNELEDDYYQHVVTAYEKIIKFIKKHEEEF